MHYIFKLALYVSILTEKTALAARTGESLAHATVCQNTNVIVELLPVGLTAVVPLSKLANLRLGRYNNGQPMFLHCTDGKPFPEKICIKDDQIFQLDPMIGKKLLPQFTTHDLSAGLCLRFSPEPPARHISYDVVHSVKEGIKKYSVNSVRASAWLTLESWLFYAYGASTRVLSLVQSNAFYQKMSEYFAALPMPPDEQLDEQIDKDLGRYHPFGDEKLNLPCSINETGAKHLLRQMLRKRIAQKRMQCWTGQQEDCQLELYSQAMSLIGGSLLAVTLEARAEQEIARSIPRGFAAGIPSGTPRGTLLDPAAVAFHLFSLYLDSDVGSLHQPGILFARLEQEQQFVFDKYYTGDDSLFGFKSWFAPVPPPKEVDFTAQQHMMRFIIQCYSMLVSTAGNTYDTIASTRLFWRYFFKSGKFTPIDAIPGNVGVFLRNRENDRTVEFHRTALLAVLSRFPVIVGRKVIKTRDFTETLQDWVDEFYKDPDTASEVLSRYLNGLHATMERESLMAGDIFRSVSVCLRNNLWATISRCKSSLSSLRLT